MIAVQGLTKRYGALQALDGLDLTAEPGQVLGILGHNGAGKSTFARLLAGLIRPDAGTVHIAGLDALADPLGARARFGYLPEESILYDALSAREQLALIGGLRAVEPDALARRSERLLDFFDLTAAADRPVAGYSRGMRRKTAIALTLVGDPQAVLFDEPLSGLDPDGADRFAELLVELRRRGKTVLVQSHALGMVAKRCDKVAVLERGRLLAHGTLDELRARAGKPGADLEELLAALTGRQGKDARGLLE